MTDERTCRCRGQFAMHKPHPHADRDGSEARAQLEREHERALAAYVPEDIDDSDICEDCGERHAGRCEVGDLLDELAARIMTTERVLTEIAAERARQTAKHGDQSHLPDGTGPATILSGLPQYQSAARADHLAHYAKARCQAASQNEGGDGSITFEHILTEEWAEAIAESDPVALRAELVQVAAVAVQWIEAIDIRAALADPKAAS